MSHKTDGQRIISSEEISDKGMKELAKRKEMPPWVLKAARALALPRGLRPRTPDLCEQLGVSARRLNYWRTNPKFTALVNQMNREFFTEYVPDVINAMKDQALAGNVKAAQLFMQWVNDFHTENPGEESPVEEATVEEVRMVIQKIKKKNI